MVTIGRRGGGDGRGGNVGCAAGARRDDRGYCRCRWDGMLIVANRDSVDHERDALNASTRGPSETMSSDDGSR